MDRERLLERLKRHEGFRSHVYKCPAGKWTIGYGRNVDPDGGGGGISEGEAEILLKADILGMTTFIVWEFDWFKTLDWVRQEVLVEMAFQLGFSGLLTKFPRTLAAIGQGNFAGAADEMRWKDPLAFKLKPSAWHEQTPTRCKELVAMMRTGEA